MAQPLMAIIIGLSALAVISCSSRDDDPPTTTPQIFTPGPATVISIATAGSSDSFEPPAPTPINAAETPTATPVTGAEATPIAIPAPTPEGDGDPASPTEPAVDLETLTVPVCQTSLSSSSPNGLGTVPHATATPLPQSNLAVIIAGVRPLHDALVTLADAGDASWSGARSTQERTSSIAFEGRRLSYLCAALSLVPPSAESGPLVSQLAGVMKDRRDVLSDAVELLRSSDVDFSVHESERERTTGDILSYGSAVEDLAAEFGISDIAGHRDFTMVNPTLDLNLNVPPGWVSVRNGIDVFIAAPSDVQRYSVSGLGPEAWKLGTAARVRRFRNETDTTLEESVDSLDSLLVRFGSRINESSIVIGKEPGIRLTYSGDNGYWQTLVGVTVVADATYLFELGCPIEFIDKCEIALSNILNGVTFNAG